MTVIGTNTASLRAGAANTAASMQLQTAMERLSTGKRINSAKDDAAGMAISTSMTSQINGMNQAVRNANDGISLAQTAEGALGEVTNMLQRIRELAVQSSSGTYSGDDRTNMNTEVQQLASQVNSILTNTKFNGNALFNPNATTDSDNFKIQVGTGVDRDAVAAANGQPAIAAVTGNTVTIPKVQIDTTNLQGDTTSTSTSGGMTTTNTTTGGLNVSTAGNAGTTITNVDNGLKAVNSARATLGASQSRLQSVVNNLTSNVNNLSDARSRIQDTDYSVETANLAKAQILSQASTAMLAQANQSQQGVLQLLR